MPAFGFPALADNPGTSVVFLSAAFNKDIKKL